MTTTSEAQDQENADQQEDIHHALSLFMDLMIGRMLSKHEQGYRAWDDPAFIQIWRRKLIECAARVYAGDSSQCVDLANWAMIVARCDHVEKERMSKVGAG